MTEEGTQNEPADTSIRASLTAALEAHETDNDEVQVQADVGGDTDSATEDAGASSESTATDESASGDGKSDDETPKLDGVSGESEEQRAAESSTEEITPPEHWSQADKDVFNEIDDPKRKQWLMDRYKAMEADHTSKTQEHSEFLKEYQAVDKVITPLRPLMAQHNMSTDQVIGMWAQTQQDLMYKPAETIQQLASQYGVDLNQFAKRPEDEGFIDPQIQALNKQISDLQASVTNQQTTAQQAAQDAVLQQINTFADEKDSNGNLKHPYFADVERDMIVQANMLKAQGLNPSLTELYEAAIWSNPQIREKQLTLQREQEQAKLKADQEKREKQRQADLAKSKQASKSVSGDGSGSTPASNDLRATLTDAFHASGGRV